MSTVNNQAVFYRVVASGGATTDFADFADANLFYLRLSGAQLFVVQFGVQITLAGGGPNSPTQNPPLSSVFSTFYRVTCSSGAVVDFVTRNDAGLYAALVQANGGGNPDVYVIQGGTPTKIS